MYIIRKNVTKIDALVKKSTEHRLPNANNKWIRDLTEVSMPGTVKYLLRLGPTFKIKPFLIITMSEERLNALAMLSINENLIHIIFYEQVVEHYISPIRRLDFVYKKQFLL